MLTASSWEEVFVDHARRTGSVRIVGRAYRAEDVVGCEPDVVVVGDETPWLTADVVGLWAALGIETVVVSDQSHPDPIERVAVSSQAVHEVMDAVRDAWLRDQEPSELVSVVGPTGSGVTEIACALSTLLAPVHFVDRDEPAAALRLAVPPHGTAAVSISSDFPVQPEKRILVDCGYHGPLPDGRCLLVVAHTPLSFVRAARLIAAWTGPVPDLVVNMTRDERHACDLAMATVGLEPRILLPYDPVVAERAAWSEAPPSWFRAELEQLLTGADDESPR